MKNDLLGIEAQRTPLYVVKRDKVSPRLSAPRIKKARKNRAGKIFEIFLGLDTEAPKTAKHILCHHSIEGPSLADPHTFHIAFPLEESVSTRTRDQ